MPGGITVLMIVATSGPPMAFTAADLSRPYSTAWRTSSLPAAPFASGLRRLNTMYGKVVDYGQIVKLGAFDATRDGIDAGLIGVSLLITSSVPACMSDSWVSAEVTPSVSTIVDT